MHAITQSIWRRAMHCIWSDPFIALLIFAFGAIWSARFVDSGAVLPQFYQTEFAPAVMLACGRGFVNPAIPASIPGLVEFLNQNQLTFTCDKIPALFKQISVDAFQGGSRYLMGAVAMVWRFGAISWQGLLPLYAVLFGLSCAAAYGVFRLGMNKWLAIVLGILFLISPLQLNNLPHLRDYAKAPFIIIIILILGCLVKYRLANYKTIFLSALAGGTLGVGIGFRMDLLIFIPAVLITLVAFNPLGLVDHIRTRGLSVLVFTLIFLAVAYPILTAFSGGSNSFHVILLGLAEPFDQALNIKPSAVYEWGIIYNDTYISELLNSYQQRLPGINRPIELATRAYDQVGMAYYGEIVRTFPADIATRFFGAVVKIIQSPGASSVFSWASGLSIVVTATSLLLISIASLRISIFLLLAILFLSGYPSLQFSERHYFPLQIVSMFFYGFLAQQMIQRASSVFASRSVAPQCDMPHSKQIFLGDGIRRILIILVIIVLGLGVKFALREYQQYGLMQLLKKYENMPIGVSEMQKLKVDEGVIRLRPVVKQRKSVVENAPPKTGYWGVEIDGPACGKSQIALKIQYLYSDSYFNNSRDVNFDTKTPIRYLFHTYSSVGPEGHDYPGRSEFDGIDVAESDLPCIKQFGPIEILDSMPLLLNLTFRKDWENDQLYQSIGRPRRNTTGAHFGILRLSFPEKLIVEHKQMDTLLLSVNMHTEQFSVLDKTVTFDGKSVTIKGDPVSLYAYVLQLPVENTKGDRYLVAEGEVYEGGFTLGLLKKNQWAGQTNITSPGKFKIVMKPEDGEYVATLAHNLPEPGLNHFQLTKLGWVTLVK